MPRTRSESAAAPSVLHQTLEIPQARPATEAEDKLSFWEQITRVPDDAWAAAPGDKGFKVYLYRDHPRGSGKGSGYKRLITQPFDIEWVKQELGGYDYRAMLNDPSGKMVSFVSFSIDAPPKDVEGAVQTSAAAAPAAASGFESQVLEMMRESSKRTEQLLERMLDRIERQPAAPAPVSSVNEQITLAVLPTVMKGVVDVMAASMPRQADPLELLKVIQGLQPRQPDILELLIKAKQAGLIPDAAPGGDLLKQVEQLGKVAEALGMTGGGSKGIGELLIEKGPAILEQMGKVVGNYRDVEAARAETARAIAAGRATAPAPPPQPAAAVQILPPSPNGAPASPMPAANGSALEVEPVGTPAPAAAPGGARFEMPVDAVKAHIVHAIAAATNGTDIVGFIATVKPELLQTLEGVSENDIAQWCANDPILRNAVVLPRFRQCVKEIVEELNGVEELVN